MQLSELVDLVVGLAVLPLLVAMMRRLRVVYVRPWWLVAYGAVVAAYVFTVAESVGGVAGEWLNLAEHIALLVAGGGYAVAAWRVRAESGEARR